MWVKVVPSVDKRRQEMIAGNQFSILLAPSVSQWALRANLSSAMRRINFYLLPFASEAKKKHKKYLMSQAFIVKSFVHVRLQIVVFVMRRKRSITINTGRLWDVG